MMRRLRLPPAFGQRRLRAMVDSSHLAVARSRPSLPRQRPGGSGILPVQTLRGAIREGWIQCDHAIDQNQVQPASIDLRLGEVAYRVRASFLAGPKTKVKSRLDELSMHTLDLTGGAVLEKDCVYIVPLIERLALPGLISAMANAKSSTGRLDVFARLITDNGQAFDQVPAGYTGPLYAEIAPRSFSILARTGSRLNQLRLRRGTATVSDAEVRTLHQQVGLVHGGSASAGVDRGVTFTVDVEGKAFGGLIGYRARKHAPVVDIDSVGAYAIEEFWAPVHGRQGGIILTPDDFYILASREHVTVPADHAAEMLAYDVQAGEFRVHYAGFFDPGFGDPNCGGTPTRAVLEVRSHEVPFLIDADQIVGRLVYEKLTEPPRETYGSKIGSHYQGQGLALGKQFITG